MTRKTLADKSGISMATICRLENTGCSIFKVNTLTAEALARALDCDIQDVFRLEDISDRGRPPMTGCPMKKETVAHESVCPACNMSTNPHVDECIHCGASMAPAA